MEAQRFTLDEPHVTSETIRDLVHAPHDDRVFRERPSDQGDEELHDGVTVDIAGGDRFWTLPRGARYQPRTAQIASWFEIPEHMLGKMATLEDALDAVLAAKDSDSINGYRLGGLAAELAAEAMRRMRISREASQPPNARAEPMAEPGAVETFFTSSGREFFQIGWWLPYDSPLNVDEDERFISLRSASDEGGLREPYKTEVVAVYVEFSDTRGPFTDRSASQPSETPQLGRMP